MVQEPSGLKSVSRGLETSRQNGSIGGLSNFTASKQLDLHCLHWPRETDKKRARNREERETKLYFLVFIARVRSHGGGREGKEAKKGLSWSENSEA